MYYGQVHRISNEYLLNYANEIAYREDNRRTSNKAQFIDVLSRWFETTNDNMNGAVIGNVKLFIKKWFGSRYMAYNIDKKLKEFEFERKQVLHHLALLDANIATLKTCYRAYSTGKWCSPL